MRGLNVNEPTVKRVGRPYKDTSEERKDRTDHLKTILTNDQNQGEIL